MYKPNTKEYENVIVTNVDRINKTVEIESNFLEDDYNAVSDKIYCFGNIPSDIVEAVALWIREKGGSVGSLQRTNFDLGSKIKKEKTDDYEYELSDAGSAMYKISGIKEVDSILKDYINYLSVGYV